MKYARSIRIEDDLWVSAQYYAGKEGRTVTAVIEAALTRYVESRHRNIEKARLARAEARRVARSSVAGAPAGPDAKE